MSLYRAYFAPGDVDPAGYTKEKICGPDVTDWFQRQLDAIKDYSHERWFAFVWYDPWALGDYQRFWATLKFQENQQLLSSENCPRDCPNTVTLCGKCFNVTELGNLAFGYGASKVIGRMLWGGIMAEVRNKNGFDLDQDILAALTGTQLNTDNICDVINDDAPFADFDDIELQIGWWISDARNVNGWADRIGQPKRYFNWRRRYSQLVGNMQSMKFTIALIVCVPILLSCDRQDFNWMEPGSGVELEKYLELYRHGEFYNSDYTVSVLDTQLSVAIVAKEYGNYWGFTKKPNGLAKLVLIPSVDSKQHVEILELPKSSCEPGLLFVVIKGRISIPRGGSRLKEGGSRLN